MYKEVSKLFEIFEKSEQKQTYEEIKANPQAVNFSLTSIMWYLKTHWDDEVNEKEPHGTEE